MTDNTETLKGLLQHLINDTPEEAKEAEAQMHEYFIAKSRDIAGLQSSDNIEAENDEDEDDEEEDE